MATEQQLEALGFAMPRAKVVFKRKHEGYEWMLVTETATDVMNAVVDARREGVPLIGVTAVRGMKPVEMYVAPDNIDVVESVEEA